MTVTNKLRQFVELIDAAEDKLNELSLDREELDALLECWYEHRRKWVAPYGTSGLRFGDEGLPFCPTWNDLSMAELNPRELRFAKWQYGETDVLYIETAYFLDPDGWIEQDKVGRVTQKTREAQRARALEADRAKRDAAAIAALEVKGYTVEKKFD